MAGLSPGTPGEPPSLSSWERGGAQEAACPSPCDRGCARGECTFNLPKSIRIEIPRDWGDNPYLRVRPTWRDSEEIGGEVSLDRCVRMISRSTVVEEVRMYIKDRSPCEDVLALWEAMKNIPSLKSLILSRIYSSKLSVSDAEAIFSVLEANSTLQKCKVYFTDCEPTEAAIVKVMVDALLQNQVLQQFQLKICGSSQISCRASEEVAHESSAMKELSRYLKAPTNALTELVLWELSDDGIIELANLLGVNKKLQSLQLSRKVSPHSKGIGRIAAVLHTNTALEELGVFQGTRVELEEMKPLVGALIPDATSGHQPNTCLHTLRVIGDIIEKKEVMEQLAILLRSNTSLLSLHLDNLRILSSENENVAEYAEMLFTALRFNASLKSLDLKGCSGLRGKHVLGMIMDMLRHNQTLRKIMLKGTGLEEDGDAEVVYTELRARNKKVDRKLKKVVGSMERVPPTSTRVFLCGNPEAGKTTLCKRWIDIEKLEKHGTKNGVIDENQPKQLSQAKNKTRMGSFISKRLRKKFQKATKNTPLTSAISNAQERTRGVEVHKMLWEDMNITLWDMAGQEEYHTFHDMLLPNCSDGGECCFYFIVCDPREAILHLNKKEPMEQLEKDLYYWLVFIASNTRRSKSYLPHVTILMTHYDLWRSIGNVEEKVFMHWMKGMINTLRNKFQLFLEFDEDLEFIPMDNAPFHCDDANKVKQHVLKHLKKMSLDLPTILKASMDLQSIVKKWLENHSEKPFLKWEVFSSSLCAKVEAFGSLNGVDNQLLEKIKKHVAMSLHNGGHIMYFEDIERVILDPHWFCQNIIGHILYNCSELNDKCAFVTNGIISRQDFKELVLDGATSYDGHFEEILVIMAKLQICYKDGHDKIMLPSLLVDSPIPRNWEVVFGSRVQTSNYLGTKLMTTDESITKLTQGFFPRLQVFFRNKFCTETYNLYSSTKMFKLFSKGISFIDDDVEVFVLLDKEDSLNILSRSSGGGDYGNRQVHGRIMEYINDLKQTPSLGCPGVTFEEHIIFPSCVENALDANALQSVSKKKLMEDVLERVLRGGNLKYTLSWKDKDNISRYVLVKELLGDEAWLDVLKERKQKMMDIEKALDSKLLANDDVENPYLAATKEDYNDDSSYFVARLVVDSMKKLMQHNQNEVMARFNEVMARLDELETNILGYQAKLTARICSNIDSLMERSLQSNNSKIPKLPYIMKSDEGGGIHKFLYKMVPGVAFYHLHFMCEHKDGFHIVENQRGCDVKIGNDDTRKFGVVMYWGLAISVMLLKVGAHVAAGMGNMVPNLTQAFATILDTPGLLDLAQPRGDMLNCLPDELKMKPQISLHDDEEAKAWLAKIVTQKCPPGGMHKMFGLTQVVYTSKSGERSGVAWVCDKHKHIGVH